MLQPLIATFLQPESFSYRTEFDCYPEWLVNLYMEERIKPYSNGFVSFIYITGIIDPVIEEEQLKRLRFCIGSGYQHRGYAMRSENCILPGDQLKFHNGVLSIIKNTKPDYDDLTPNYLRNDSPKAL